MSRSAPSRHSVRGHTRSGFKVRGYTRGHGTGVARSSGPYHPPRPVKPERHGRKTYKPGESISYKNSRGERVSGTVRAVRAEYYIVERKDRLYKVDRHSVFRQIGSALKRGGELSKRLVVATPGALQRGARVAGAVAGAPKRTQTRVKRFGRSLKAEYKKGQQTGLSKQKRKK